MRNFASVADAVRCAVEVQREMAGRNTDVPSDRHIEFRMGINVGDIIRDGRDIYGDEVNVPAQITEVLKKVEAVGFDEVILYFNVGLKPHSQIKDEMARFMAEMAPAFT